MFYGLEGVELAIALIVSVAGVVLVIVLTREVWCWMFKINERIALMKAISRKLGAEIEAPPPPEDARASRIFKGHTDAD